MVYGFAIRRLRYQCAGIIFDSCVLRNLSNLLWHHGTIKQIGTGHDNREISISYIEAEPWHDTRITRCTWRQQRRDEPLPREPDGEGSQPRAKERNCIMATRELNASERARLASGRGVTDLAVTCEADAGYGPCGTYHDWKRGRCLRGHKIEIEDEEQS